MSIVLTIADGLRVPLVLAGAGGPAPTLVGVRPQHLEILALSAEPAAGAGVLEAVVDVVEPMGWEAYLHLRVGRAEEAAVAHVEIEEVSGLHHGQPVRLSVVVKHVHLFAEAGRRIQT